MFHSTSLFARDDLLHLLPLPVTSMATLARKTNIKRKGSEQGRKKRRHPPCLDRKKDTATIFGYEKESKQKSNPNPSFEITPKPEIMRNRNESTNLQQYVDREMNEKGWAPKKTFHRTRDLQ